MRSDVKTPPTLRKSWSASSASSAASSELGTCGTFASSSGGRSYRSLSTGGGGSMRLLMPSSPACSIAENARYGLHDGSGQRNSRRFAVGLFEYSGMRTDAEWLRCEYTRFTGESQPGTSRLYEFVVGAANARI